MFTNSKGLLTVASIALAADSMMKLNSNQNEKMVECDRVGQQLKFCTTKIKSQNDINGCIEFARAASVFCPDNQDVAKIKECLKHGKTLTCRELALSQMGLSHSVHAVTLRIGREIKELKALASGGAQVPELKRQILSLLCYLRGLDLDSMCSFKEGHEIIRKHDVLNQASGPAHDNIVPNETERNPEGVVSELGNDDGGWEDHGPGLGEDYNQGNHGLSEVGGSQGDGDGANNTSFFAEDGGAELYIREHLGDLIHKLEQLSSLQEAPSAVPPQSLGRKFLALVKGGTLPSDQLREKILREEFL